MNQTALIILIVAAGITSLACVICSAILLWHKREGWGWFLFAAVVIAGAAWPTFKIG